MAKNNVDKKETMAVKIKKIQLQNFCGYRDTTYDFTDGSGNIKPLSVFYGKNGFGKTTLLHAINFLGIAKRFTGMDSSMLFRKYTFHEDYDPTYANFQKSEKEMVISGVFDVDGIEKEVIINSKEGVVKNELPYSPVGWTYFTDSDSPLNLNKFQLNKNQKEKFLDLARTVYDLECELQDIYDDSGNPVFNELLKGIEDSSLNKEGEDVQYFYTDFIIKKFETSVHYKSFSGGEKKLSTLLRFLCDADFMDFIDIILIDSIEKEIYFTRHMPLINKLLEIFSNKQFIITTHSSKIIEEVDEKYLYDVTKYKEIEWKKYKELLVV